jgi:hypothetical protein
LQDRAADEISDRHPPRGGRFDDPIVFRGSEAGGDRAPLRPARAPGATEVVAIGVAHRGTPPKK